MKQVFYLGLFLLMVACSQSEPEGLKIFGNAAELSEGDEVYLEAAYLDRVEQLDTVQIDDQGNFQFFYEVENPAFFRLNFDGKQIVSLVLTGEEEQVTVNVDGNRPQGFVEVSGSYDTEYKNQMDVVIREYQEKMLVMRQEMNQARRENDDATFEATQERLRVLSLETQVQLKQKIREASPSLAAFYAVRMLDPTTNFAFMDSIASQLEAEMPENLFVQSLVERMDAERGVSIGTVAPEIELQNPEGTVVKLSSLRGKYVLIDFWAAWCRPCRAENPNVVRMYNKYKEDEFEIYGVSLDKTREAWLKAIEQDGLPWVHVSDLKFWKSVAAQDYKVGSIPATFLIDPEGRIIAKNLRGASLEAKLEEIFG